jgi:hypothetical protein
LTIKQEKKIILKDKLYTTSSGRPPASQTIYKYNYLIIFAAGKSYTASSCRTPPGSEDSKGMWLSGAI